MHSHFILGSNLRVAENSNKSTALESPTGEMKSMCHRRVALLIWGIINLVAVHNSRLNVDIFETSPINF